MKKTLLTITLLTLLTLTFTGCGQNNTTTSDTTHQNQTTSSLSSSSQKTSHIASSKNISKIQTQKSFEISHTLMKNDDNSITITGYITNPEILSTDKVVDFSEKLKLPILIENKNVEVISTLGTLFPNKAVTLGTYGRGNEEKKSTIAVTIIDLQKPTEIKEKIEIYSTTFTPSSDFSEIEVDNTRLKVGMEIYEVENEVIR